MKLVAYVRGSTIEQQNTLTAQEEEIRTWAAAHGHSFWQPGGVFIDSGTSAESTRFLERPVVKKMLAFMAENQVDQFVITKLDRAFRNVKDCVVTLDELAHRGIEFAILQLQLDTRTPWGKAMLHILATMAELENGIRRERQAAAYQVMRGEGRRLGEVPFGMKAVPNEAGKQSRSGRVADQLVEDPNEMAVRAWIVEQTANGCGRGQIAEALNGEGITAKKGGRWYASTILKVLRAAGAA